MIAEKITNEITPTPISKISTQKRKPVIIVIANNVDTGIAYQRAHIFMRELRDYYDFQTYSIDEVGNDKFHYADLMVMAHPYTQKNSIIIKRAKGQYGIPVVVDIDDLIDQLPTDHPGHVAFKGNKGPECVMFADHLTVSTTFIQNAYAHLNANSTVIENAIDPQRYGNAKDRILPMKAGFVVGWTGGQSHAPDLSNTGFIEGLARAMREHDDIRAHFHILCSEKLVQEFGARVVFNSDPVEYLDYPALCYSFPWDVCAVPLYDHPFNDAKSDLRLLDMAPFKIPVIASPRDQFRRHQGTGRLILTQDDSPESWYQAIVGAYQNRQRLAQIAETANQYVFEERTARRGASQWHDVFQKLLSQNK